MKRILLAICMTFFFGLETGAVAAPVNDVRMVGLTSDLIDPVKSLSGVLPGDEYEVNRVNRGKTKILDYLEGKGYPQATLQTELKVIGGRRILEFNIELGEPIRISEVGFKAKNEEISSALLQRLNQVVDLKPGELFDRDRIKDMRRSVETVLFAQNFIDSKVTDLSTEISEAGLKLTFSLELGQKVVLSVSNNVYFSRPELMAFIDDQRAQGLGRDYISVLMNKIRDQYIEHGFRSVKITPYSFEPHGTEAKKVVFDIEEGPRVYIKNIIFDGNEVFKDEDLKNFFYTNASDRIAARIYNEKMSEDAAKGMIEELKKRGYLSAKLIAIKMEEIDDTAVNLRIFVSEGLQTRIQAIEFRKNIVFPSDKLDEFLGLREGDPLNLVQLEDGIEKIKKQYRNLGYINFKIGNEANIVSYSEKNQYAYLNFDFDEGHVIKLARFDIFGNDNTHRIVIERELKVKIGEPLAETRTNETEERLRRLGIFSQVNLEFTDSSTTVDAKDMRVAVQEAIPGNTSAGIGFRNDLGVRVFGGLSYSNLWGMNHTWSLDVAANRRIQDYRFGEYSAAVSYTWPWALFGETTFRPSLTAQRMQYLEFNADTYALSLSADRMIYSPLKLSGGLTYSLEKIRQFQAIDPTQNQQLQIGSITPTLRMDLRDNPLVPRNGLFFLTSFEYASSAFGSQSTPVPVSYWRYQARVDYYASFIPHVVWFNSVRGGYLKNLIDPRNADGSINPDVTVPLIKQFALGGINSIRGFSEQQINVQSQNDNARVVGYSTYINYRTQLDFFPTQNLSLGPFLDSGNLQVDAFSLGNLRYGTGVGLRYLTPVGPVNFDWGFNLFPRRGEPGNVFYFSLGVI